jgi:hypothetical protein
MPMEMIVPAMLGADARQQRLGRFSENPRAG